VHELRQQAVLCGCVIDQLHRIVGRERNGRNLFGRDFLNRRLRRLGRLDILLNFKARDLLRGHVHVSGTRVQAHDIPDHLMPLGVDAETVVKDGILTREGRDHRQ
jgi:hypothetical protein